MLLRSLTPMALEMVQHCHWKTSYWLKSVTSVAYWLYALEKEMVFLVSLSVKWIRGIHVRVCSTTIAESNANLKNCVYLRSYTYKLRGNPYPHVSRSSTGSKRGLENTAKDHLDLGGRSGSFFGYSMIGTLTFSALRIKASVWMHLGHLSLRACGGHGA